MKKTPSRAKKIVSSKHGKVKISPAIQAKWDIIARHMFEAVADEKRKTAIIDPTAKHDVLATMMGDLLFGKPSEADRDYYGKMLLANIEELSPEELETEFSVIVAMKRKAADARANKGHKNARFALFWTTFKKEFARKPESKAEFVEYTASKGLSFPASASGRTRIYKLLGINHLPQRRGNGKK